MSMSIPSAYLPRLKDSENSIPQLQLKDTQAERNGTISHCYVVPMSCVSAGAEVRFWRCWIGGMFAAAPTALIRALGKGGGSLPELARRSRGPAAASSGDRASSASNSLPSVNRQSPVLRAADRV